MKTKSKIITKLFVISDVSSPRALQDEADCEVWTWQDLRRAIASNPISLIWSFDHVILVEAHPFLRPRPFLVALALWGMSRKSCVLMDGVGKSFPVTFWVLLRQFLTLLREGLSLPSFLAEVRREVATLASWVERREKAALASSGSILYLKTDLWFATTVGGSVAHMAGVANFIGTKNGYSVDVFTTAANPLLKEEIRTQEILPPPKYWNFRDIPALMFSQTACRQVLQSCTQSRPAFIYQRYSLNNYAAVVLARQLQVPLVTEYNGSEVWIGKNWGRPVAYPQLSDRIEHLNLYAADLIVVVSAASRDELVSRRIDPARILVNPNGVDPDVFTPDARDPDLRQSLGLTDRRVIGFIGTFGPWHGTEELVRAFAALLADAPEKRQQLHLLMVGDGVRREAAQSLARELDVAEQTSFIGLVPQVDGPRYLACCDLLVAPHVPNPDGTPFFGSPTKLFEYMAMGRPILASRLGQMADMLQHMQTAWLVEPGDAQALARGLARLLDDPKLCEKLGNAARAHVQATQTWQIHASRILRKLEDVCR